MAVIRPLSEKQRHAISLVAALIVFLTFVLKDIYRERAKELADGTRAAETAAEMQNDLLALAVSTGKLGRQLDAIGRQVSENAKRRYILLMDEGSDMYTNAINDMYGKDKLSLSISANLADQLGESSDIRAEISDLQHDFRDATEERQRLFKAQEDEINRQVAENKSIDIMVTMPEEIRRWTGTFHDRLRALSERITKTQERVFVRAHGQRDLAEKHYRISTRVSYFTYSLGWLLGFVALLSGGKAEGGD
jgi:hypothetical protein